MLGKPDIETLGVLTIKYNTIGRQLASEDKANKMQINCQWERAVQTEGGKLERYLYNRQDANVQKQYNAANTDESHKNRRKHVEAQEQYNSYNVEEPDVVPNPMVMGNSSRNQSLLSDAIIN